MPLSDQTILCLATQGWDAHWTPVQQVMLRLAPANRILYFEPFHSILRRVIKGRVASPASRQPQLREVHPNLFIYRPGYPYLPFQLRSKLSAACNAPLYKREIASLLERFGAKSPWLWAFFAQSLSVLELSFEKLIYDCLDEWPAFFPDPREKRFVAEVDETLCRRANLVFTGSETLRQKKSQWNPSTFVVNHAADVEHFMTATNPDTRIPADLESVPHPRIGFIGMVDSIRFDTDLVRRICEQPQYQVVIVGGLLGGMDRQLPSLPNLHILGMKSIADLPGYLKGMDVLLMPYRLNEATKSIYPLKLHEYLATGKPVVATTIPAVEDFRDLIYVAPNQEQFLQKIGDALSEADPALHISRMECARHHNWQNHVDQKIKIIDSRLLTTP
jgi:glycosyltransferase involved in cell wall biosynthesis